MTNDRTDESGAAVPKTVVDTATKWLAAGATLISVALSVLAFVQDSHIQEAEAKRKTAEDALIESDRRLREAKQRILLSPTFRAEGAGTVGKLFDGTMKVVTNTVFHELSGAWQRPEDGNWALAHNLMRCVYGLYQDKGIGILGVRQIVYLELSQSILSNPDHLPAEDIQIVSRTRSFATPRPGERLVRVIALGSLDDLQPAAWTEESTTHFGRLEQGQTLIVPLAHTIGPQGWLGHVEFPMQITWKSPNLDERERLVLDPDETTALIDAALRGSILGNLSATSCPHR